MNKFDATDPDTYPRTVSIDSLPPAEFFAREGAALQASMARHPAGKGRSASLVCGHAECVTGLPCKRQDPAYWQRATGRVSLVKAASDAPRHASLADLDRALYGHVELNAGSGRPDSITRVWRGPLVRMHPPRWR